MKKFLIIMLTLSLLAFTSCELVNNIFTTTQKPIVDPPGFFEGVQVDLNMDMDFPIVDNMPSGEGKPLKVIFKIFKQSPSKSAASNGKICKGSDIV